MYEKPKLMGSNGKFMSFQPKDPLKNVPEKLQEILYEHLDFYDYYTRRDLRAPLSEKFDCPKIKKMKDKMMMFAERNPKFKQPLLYLFSLPCKDVSVDYFKINTALMDMVKLLKEINGTISYDDLLVLLKFIIYEYPIFCWDGINALIVYEKFTSITSSEVSEEWKDIVTRFQFPDYQEEFMVCLQNLLKREFCSYDINTVNNVLRIVRSCFSQSIKNPAGDYLVEFLLPKMLLKFDFDSGKIIDPAEEVKNPPSEDLEYLESEDDTSMISIGDINFHPYGLYDEHAIISSLRIIPDYIREATNISYQIDEKTLMALKEECEGHLQLIGYMESEVPKLYHVFEYNDDLFVLYQDGTKSEDGYPLIKGYSMVTEKTTEEKMFDYEIDPEEIYRIKPYEL